MRVCVYACMRVCVLRQGLLPGNRLSRLILAALLICSGTLAAQPSKPAYAFDPHPFGCTPTAALSVRADGPGWSTVKVQELDSVIQYLNTQFQSHWGGSWIPTARVASGGVPIRLVSTLSDQNPGNATCGSDTAPLPVSLIQIWDQLPIGAPLQHILAHEILHGHGFSHSGGRRPNGGTASLENLMENPATIAQTSTCFGSPKPLPGFSPDDAAQASWRMTGQGVGGFLFANPGFEQSSGPLPHGAWAAWGYAGSTYGEVVTSAGGGYDNTNRFARIPGYGGYLYQAVSVPRTGTAGGAFSRYHLTMAYRGSAVGNVGWEAYTVPRDYAFLSSNPCGFPGNLDFNGSNFVGGWQLVTGSGAQYGTPQVGNGSGTCPSLNRWCTYNTPATVSLPRTAPWYGTGFLVNIYNHLSGGVLDVDNITIYRAN